MPKPTTAPRRYHVQLVSGERTITASGVGTDDGALVLTDNDGNTKVMYAAGQWLYVELETQDD